MHITKRHISRPFCQRSSESENSKEDFEQFIKKDYH